VLITWIDSRPTWDDAGITAGLIVLTTAAFGAARPRLAWLWALLIGSGIPLVGIVTRGDFSILLVLVIAFAGAYAGALVGTLLRRWTPADMP
jgi:hypothetical protein